jgi:hypothetical protein
MLLLMYVAGTRGHGDALVLLVILACLQLHSLLAGLHCLCLIVPVV